MLIVVTLFTFFPKIKLLNVQIDINVRLSSPGVVASSSNPATWRLGTLNVLRSGVLLSGALCRSGVRTKLGIDMDSSAEAEDTRLSKEERIGPGRKRSRQKCPCQAVVGSHL